ncbi:MAG: hypothetical protein LBG16_04275, partial [Elusimicrobiota bacterium]|nr:hypothetical protein [Elusimicrobiota bacterium]
MKRYALMVVFFMLFGLREGNVFANQFTSIDTEGTHAIQSDEYGSASSYFAVMSSTKDITVNVDGGAGILKFGNAGIPVTGIGYYLNADDDTGAKGHLNFNGNLEVYALRASSFWTPFQVNNNSGTQGASITVNGAIKAELNNIQQSSGSVQTLMITAMDGGHFIANGNIDLSGSAISQNGNASNYAIFVDPNVNVGTSITTKADLGNDMNDIINIHNITVKAAKTAENIGITGYGYDKGIIANPDKYFINVHGKASIDNLLAETSSSADSALSVAVYAQYEGQINFFSDLKINNIAATGVNAEAYAIYASDSGIINVNPNNDQNEIIQIEGNIIAIDDDGSYIDAAVNVNLTNADSYFLGETASNGTASVNINLSNGAQWRT